MNLAARGYVGKGDAAMILGFMVRGGDQLVLARAVGPGLARLNVADPTAGSDHRGHRRGSKGDRLEHPLDVRLVTNPGAEIESVDAAVSGAFALDDADSALLLKLKPGNYSMVVRSRSNSVGNVLTEIYEIPLSAAGGNRAAGN